LFNVIVEISSSDNNSLSFLRQLPIRRIKESDPNLKELDLSDVDEFHAFVFAKLLPDNESLTKLDLSSTQIKTRRQSGEINFVLKELFDALRYCCISNSSSCKQLCSTMFCHFYSRNSFIKDLTLNIDDPDLPQLLLVLQYDNCVTFFLSCSATVLESD
jgi:hypothetical protein